jgi:hypothetical protein
MKFPRNHAWKALTAEEALNILCVINAPPQLSFLANIVDTNLHLSQLVYLGGKMEDVHIKPSYFLYIESTGRRAVLVVDLGLGIEDRNIAVE